MLSRRSSELNDELVTLGNRVLKLIKEKGYASVYQFWIYEAGDDFSRPSLEKIIRGQSDPKLSTLLKLSQLLNIHISELLEENQKGV